MSSLPWTPEDDAAEAERWASESQRPAPAGPWVSAREATPEEVRMINRLLDEQAERDAGLLMFVALVAGMLGMLVGALIGMGVER